MSVIHKLGGPGPGMPFWALLVAIHAELEQQVYPSSNLLLTTRCADLVEVQALRNALQNEGTPSTALKGATGSSLFQLVHIFFLFIRIPLNCLTDLPNARLPPLGCVQPRFPLAC